MKSIRISLDEALIEAVDRAARSLRTTRSAFTRDALKAALASLQEREMELRHRAGYERRPVEAGELSDWESEQAWSTNAPADPDAETRFRARAASALGRKD
jgi:predicted transcriptional regulator